MRKYLLLYMLFFLPLSSYTQEAGRAGSERPPLAERVFFGGTFGLQLGTYTYIDASPVAGVWILPPLAVAAGPSYKYLKDPGGSTDVIGGKVLSRLVIVNDLNEFIPLGFRMSLYLQGEYERLSLRSDFFYTSYTDKRFPVDIVLAGAGISQYVGRKSSVNFTILWVMNETEVEVYDSPEFRVGFTF